MSRNESRAAILRTKRTFNNPRGTEIHYSTLHDSNFSATKRRRFYAVAHTGYLPRFTQGHFQEQQRIMEGNRRYLAHPSRFERETSAFGARTTTLR